MNNAAKKSMKWIFAKMNAKKAGSASLDSLSELRRIPANCEKANRKIECKKKKICMKEKNWMRRMCLSVGIRDV